MDQHIDFQNFQHFSFATMRGVEITIYIYVNVTNGWIKQQDNTSTRVSYFLQSSGVHILHIRFPRRKNNRMKILF